MGTWGVGIYSNDVALDVKDMCNDVFAFCPYEEGLQIIFREFDQLLHSNLIDNDYASFWYALADWQWNHGILSNDIRIKTMELLSHYAGIEEWQESGNLNDVKKRKSVLIKLRDKLKTEMPIRKLPPQRLIKPKHAPGDVIIFQANDEDDFAWEIEMLSAPWAYKSEWMKKYAPVEAKPAINCKGKFFAILCVDKIREKRAEYLPEIFDEYSVYAFYDYCSDVEPTIQDLQQCGFLPSKWNDYDRDKKMVFDINWTYTFYIYTSWSYSKREVETMKKVVAKSEPFRFQSAFSAKNYSANPLSCMGLEDAFGTFFEEKTRLQILNQPIDTLLNNDLRNPELENVVYQTPI